MAGTTSLLRTAQATKRKIQAEEDSLVAYEWESSAQTYEDFLAYSKFLEGRLGTSTGSTQLTYQNKIRSARRSYVSNEIQRAQQSIQSGRGTIQDKKQAVENLWNQAIDNNDMNLAQNLVSNWNSLDIQEQSQREAAVVATERLSRAEESYQKKVGSSYAGLAQDLEGNLANLTRAYNRGGQLEYNKAAKDFVEQNKGTLKELGIELPANYSSNVGQLVEGVVEAIGQYYLLAADATRPTSPDSAENYMSKAQDIMSGAKEFNTPAGRLSYQNIREFSQNPGGFVESTDNEGNATLKRSTVSGYRIDENGNVVPQYSGMTREQLKDENKYRKQLEKLGFGNVRYDEETGTYTVQLTGKSSEWLRAEDLGKTSNAEIRLEPTASGFQYLDRNSKKLFNIATDKRGLGGLFLLDPAIGPKHIQGQYGFDQANNSLRSNIASVITPRKWVIPMKNPEQQRQDMAAIPGSQNIPLFTPGLPKSAAPAQALLNSITGGGKPGMARRPDGGFNFTDSRGNPISAYSYAKQTGQSFRGVLSNLAGQGDAFAKQALQFAGDDGAYNPAQVSLDVAKNWSSLTWGNQVNLQTPQAARVAGVTGSYKPTAQIPLFKNLRL